MATKIARLLKTEMTDFPLPALAQLVRAGGRGKDTILAHITPEEAQVLKDRGGSGKTNPNTGLPEYQMDYAGGFEPDIGGGYEYAAPGGIYDTQPYTPAPSYAPDYGTYAPAAAERGYDFSGYSAPAGGGYAPAPSGGYAPAPTAPIEPQPIGLAEYGPGWYAGEGAGPTAAAATEGPSAYRQVMDYISRNKEWLSPALKLGGGAVGAIPALGQIGRARRGAAKVAAQQQQLGYPYQTAGQQMTAAAQRGELTPERQQAFQAAQAQLAQQQAQTGFVGSQAYATQLQAFRNQLLQNQYDYGLKAMNIGDQYVRLGLQAGLNADQQVQQSISNFYGSLGKIVGGVAV
jgi:hypothetical protein